MQKINRTNLRDASDAFDTDQQTINCHVVVSYVRVCVLSVSCFILIVLSLCLLPFSPVITRPRPYVFQLWLVIPSSCVLSCLLEQHSSVIVKEYSP